MYARLYQQCNSTGAAQSSITKFLPPDTCNYYIVRKQIAKNIIKDAKVVREFELPCIDYSNLAANFKKIVKNETNSEYNLLDPASWGPGAWKFLTAIAFHYPNEPSKKQQEAATQFFTSLQNLLPCEKCKQHFADNLKQLPLDTTSRDSLSRWVVDFHNLVNESLGKSKLNYDDVAAQYTECENCSLE